MAKKKFNAIVERVGPRGAWSRIQVPFDAEKAFGTKARIAVKGTLNGFSFRTSILPNGDGTHHLPLNKALLAGADATADASIEVVMEKDEDSREAAAPSDLVVALGKSAEAKQVWGAKTPTFRAEYIAWIEEAKAPETRARRIATTVDRVALGKRRYD